MSIRQAQPPWLKEGERDRWITVNQFARLMHRSPKSIYRWLYEGTIPEFGYRAFRDPMGRWSIQVRRQDLAHLDS